MNSNHEKEFQQTKREDVEEKEFKQALKVLLEPTRTESENREPTNEELSRKFKMERG